MSNWREPITDRTIADVRNYDAGSLDYQKGALNADDLNRIEDNYKYLMAKLRRNAIFIPHRLRNYTETVLEYVEKDNSILPDGYTQVEFIQSSGTQWIDSGIPFNVNNEYAMETECEWLDGDNTYSGWNAGGQFGNYSGYWGAGNSSSKTTAPIDGWAKIRLTIQAGSSSNTVIEVTQNGTTVSATRTHGSMASYATLNYPIFAYTNNSGGFQSYASTRMKSYKIWVNGTLTRNFIPCKNASGVAGMYDLVEGKFYGNSGTGNFLYVEPVELPDGYTLVEYIQSNGTQYIDTGYKVNSNLRIVMDAQFTSTASNQSFFGGRTSGSSLDAMWIGWNGSNIYADYTNNYRFNYSASPTNRITVEMNKNVCTVNGETQTFTAHTFTSNYTLTLFALNNGGSLVQFSSMKLYSCQVYDNDILVRDYIPVLDANGVACLYDKLHHVYYRNKGTGTFTSGPEVPVETEPVYELIETQTTYTDWQENNLPWLSEINRIRANYNALVRLFLVGLGFSEQKESNYLDYIEVNNWEKIALAGKTMFENMEKEYRYCGVEISGGDRLL